MCLTATCTGTTDDPETVYLRKTLKFQFFYSGMTPRFAKHIIKNVENCEEFFDKTINMAKLVYCDQSMAAEVETIAR